MIIGEHNLFESQLQFTALCTQLSEVHPQLNTSNPAIIVESARGAYQVATLALGSRIAQHSALDDFIQQPNVLIIALDPQIETIKLEHVKLIQKHFSYKTTNNTPLLAIIPDATQLSLPVQNALLKTAEELQAPHYIIFGVQNADQLLPTIQSRSQVITLTTQEQATAEEITNFWQTFLPADISARKQLIETHFSKKTKKGQLERDRIEDYIIGLQRLTFTASAEQLKMIEYFRKICHTVNSQLILDSFLFL
jgi:hypothetical protein